ncbi:MAG: PIG-L family deacetylase [Methanobacteriota archaeon]|nr:MAG: PIG-L family deacetylase [Euryarchaeota archaeon]
MSDGRTVLVLAPHTDDGELGCGGTIAKEVERGSEVIYVAFSSADRSLPEGYPKGTLKKELTCATKVLGVRKDHVVCYDYDVRNFHVKRQDILDEMLRLREEYGPTVVFAPSLNDLHQDHKIVAEEARRMFKRTSILGYEMPWNNISFDTLSFSVLEKRHVDQKVEALKCYESQRHRAYLNSDFINSLALARGVQVSVPYAEAFEVVRWIMP